MEETVHEPVMVAEVLSYLQAEHGGVFLDCTAGGGGHSEAILNAHPENRLFAIDKDETAVARTFNRLKKYGDRVFVTQGSFTELPETFVNIPFTGMLADLGISSDQLAAERGFSFNDTGSLDMRMHTETGSTAADIVNDYSEQALVAAFRRGGVTNGARVVAQAILRDRPFSTAKQLSDCIHKVIGERAKGGARDSATVFFQAIRIEVNNELAEIDALLNFAHARMTTGGRLVVLCFHSLEDKLVARTMRTWATGEEFSALWRGPKPERLPSGRFLTRKAVVPTADEVANNPRSRSTRLRAFEFVKQ